MCNGDAFLVTEQGEEDWWSQHTFSSLGTLTAHLGIYRGTYFNETSTALDTHRNTPLSSVACSDSAQSPNDLLLSVLIKVFCHETVQNSTVIIIRSVIPFANALVVTFQGRGEENHSPNLVSSFSSGSHLSIKSIPPWLSQSCSLETQHILLDVRWYVVEVLGHDCGKAWHISAINLRHVFDNVSQSLVFCMMQQTGFAQFDTI